MKKIIIVTIILGLLGGLVACGGGGGGTPSTPTSSSDAPSKTIIVGTAANYPPMEYEEGGQIVGFDIDLIKEIARLAGYGVEVKNLPREELFTALKNKEIDVVAAALPITEEAKKEVAFVGPYLEGGQGIVIKKDRTDIRGPQDLAGKKVGVIEGSAGEEALQTLGLEGVEVSRYTDPTLGLSDVDSGKIDAFINDFAQNSYFIKEMTANLLQIVQKLTAQDYGFAVRQDDHTLREGLSQALQKSKSLKTYEDIYKKWFK